jgi:uncharacterized 2Fe-2S/4Fe-4S cluster protein (DUF4445 family)
MSPKELVTISFKPGGMNVEAERGSCLLDVMKAVSLAIRSDCGGKGICGKCRVITKDQTSLTQVTRAEKDMIPYQLKLGYRLACECSVVGDATVYLPKESRNVVRRILVEGAQRRVRVEPIIRKVFLRISPPTLQDVRSDAKRLQDAVNEIYGIKGVSIDYQLMKELPRILRNSDWRVTAAILDEREVISLEKGNTTEEAYGIAVDIGTSKVIIYLIDLFKGRLIAAESVENPQTKHGEDVISRISYSDSKQRVREMQQLVISTLNKLILQACKKSGLKPRCIYEATVVGNTAMHHFILGLQPKHLGLSPYVPVVATPINEKARNLGLRLNTAANVYVFPIIAGFLGGDAVADIISTGIYESDDLEIALDIGTNTEVVIGNKDGLMACSCASGPAFEGAHVKCGMKAATGAIERLRIETKKFSVDYKVIDGSKPLGLCGSGIIDAVASLLKCGLIDRNGALADSSLTPRIKGIGKKKSFVLVSRTEGAARDIVITQQDIREVQMAKAAIYTGCYILMKRKKVSLRDLKKLHVAGAFGNYLDLENSKMIGLLPDVPTELISLVGNAAGAGARMALISKKLRETAAVISRRVDYVELASEPDFQEEFTSAMFFPHKDLNRFNSIKKLF